MYNLSNSVQLVGNLGKDVEVRTLDSGRKVAQTTIATNRFYTNAKGEKVQEVQWHNIVAWNRTAELMEQLLQKGTKVMIQGSLKNETYTTKDGEIRYTTKVKVNEFQKLAPKAEQTTFSN